MSDDSSGTLQVSDSYLRDFANTKIQSFITELATAKCFPQTAAFAGTGTPGSDATGGYNQLLTGNSKGNFISSTTLQADFKTFATALDGSVSAIATAARTLVVDLQMVDSVLSSAEDSADITAAEMMADLQNITFGSSSTTPPPVPPTTGA